MTQFREPDRRRDFELVSFGIESTFELRTSGLSSSSHSAPPFQIREQRSVERCVGRYPVIVNRGLSAAALERREEPVKVLLVLLAEHARVNGQLLSGFHVLEHDRRAERELALVRVLDVEDQHLVLLVPEVGSSHKSDMMMTRPRRFTRSANWWSVPAIFVSPPGLTIESWCRSAFKWAGVLRGGT